MITVVCFLMVTTLGLEYVRLMFHPVDGGYSTYVVHPASHRISVLTTTTNAQILDSVTSSTETYPLSKATADYHSQGANERRLMQSEPYNAANHNDSHTMYEHVLRSHLVRQNLMPKPQRWYHKKVNKSVRLTEKERRWHKMQIFHARNKGVGISGDLLRLLGIVLPLSSSLNERGFHNTAQVASQLHTVKETMKHNPLQDGSRHGNKTLSNNIIARGGFQEKQIKKYCNENGLSFARLPSTPQALATLFTHLLYDDSKRVVFCYVPKNGCSNMKRLLLILNGVLSPESSQHKRPSEYLLKKLGPSCSSAMCTKIPAALCVLTVP
jgi:hypothetical protein